MIGATTTTSGLKVRAVLDAKPYEPGEKIGDEEMRRLHLKRHASHGDWNYTLHPRSMP